MEHVETVIVGAGQAGLATAYHLKRRGRDCLVLDAHQRVGDNWRRLWDSLRLYSPARYDALPGLPFPAKPWSCPGKDDVADYLEPYAAHHALPVRLGVRVERLSSGRRRLRRCTPPAASSAATTSWSRPARSGARRASRRSRRELDPEHPAAALQRVPPSRPARPTARCSWSAPPTPAPTSRTSSPLTHPTVLAGRDCGQIPVPHRVEADAGGLAGAGLRVAARPHPAYARWDARRCSTSASTAPRCCGSSAPTSTSAASTAPRSAWSASSTASRCSPTGGCSTSASIVWCTGYRQDFSWIDLPVMGDDGWPAEYRGVAEDHPGLFFCGLSFQFALQLDGAARRRSRRRPCRRPDRRSQRQLRGPATSTSSAADRAA